MAMTTAGPTTGTTTTTTTTASTASGSGVGQPIVRSTDRPRIWFPEPPAYWSMPGEQPNFRTWWTMVENYIACLDEQHDPTEAVLLDSYKNWLLYSLLGAEGIARFASHPMGSQLCAAMFASFSKAVREFFQPDVNPLRARFDLSLRKQQEGESAAEFLGALRTLLIDCEITDQGEYCRILAQQLAHGCRSQETLKKLLAVGEVDPDRLFKVMQDEERAGVDAAVMHRGALSKLGAVSSSQSFGCNHVEKKTKTATGWEANFDRKQPATYLQ